MSEPPLSVREELADAITSLGTLPPDDPMFGAQLALAIVTLARRLDDLRERVEELRA